MIRDTQNTFVDNTDIASAESNVIFVGGGDAVKEMYLYATVAAGTGGTVTLKTADAESMSGAVTLGEYPLAAAAPVRARVPIGMKKYLQVDVSAGSCTGKLSAFLAYDVNVE